MSTTALLGVAGIAASVAAYQYQTSRSANRPPGPPGLPIFGNALQVPTIKTWRYFDDLSKKYGPIMRFSLAGDNVLVLTKAKDANELLGKRSVNYSSRRPLIYAGKYQSNHNRITLMSYGERHRRQRTAFQQMLKPRGVGAYESIQDIESVKLIYEILTRPSDYMRHCKRFSASLVFNLSYGRRMADDDEDLEALSTVVDAFIQDAFPGAHLVDTFPILDKLPNFLAPWRKEAMQKHEREVELYQRLALDVKERMDAGEHDLECFAARLWEAPEDTKLSLEELSYVAGTAFSAGTDTTTGTILWSMMAMLLFPEALKKAQAELDAVLGADGSVIPQFSHIDDLPYCVAFVKEVFRWSPASPGGFPHFSENDDQYEGYLIDGKTMVVPCIWSMHHDESEYPDAFKFNPGRFERQGAFEEHDSLTEGHYGFGFGRRKCPGLYLASKSVWIAITRLIWAFDFTPVIGEDGKPLPVSPDNCTSGLTSKPTEFPVNIRPRSERHARTMEKEFNVNQ